MAYTDTYTHTETETRDADTLAALRILFTVAVLVAGWATSVALWGIPGLYIPALALVPVAWVALIVISRG